MDFSKRIAKIVKNVNSVLIIGLPNDIILAMSEVFPTIFVFGDEITCPRRKNIIFRETASGLDSCPPVNFIMINIEKLNSLDSLWPNIMTTKPKIFFNTENPISKEYIKALKTASYEPVYGGKNYHIWQHKI